MILLKSKVGLLQLAARRNNMPAVKFLLENGARLDLEDVNGNSALSDARRKNHTEIVSLLEAVLSARGKCETHTKDGRKQLLILRVFFLLFSEQESQNRVVEEEKAKTRKPRMFCPSVYLHTLKLCLFFLGLHNVL